MKDQDVIKLFRNKRVAVVGPAPYLGYCKIGKTLDKYDIICRINELHIPSRHEASYGSRTDVVFHNLNSDDGIRCFREDLERYPEQCKNIKAIICPQKHCDDAGVNIIDLFHGENRYGIPFFHLGDHFVDDCRSLVGVKLNTGMLSIMSLLNYDVEELFVTGISFYAEGNVSTKVYRDDASLKGGSPYASGELSHPQLPQKEFFKSLLNKRGDRIKIDSYLNNILGMWHTNVIEI